MLTARIDIERGRIILPRYLFPTRKTRVLEREEIVEIVDWFPPAIVTIEGEFLLVSRTYIEILQAYCQRQNVPFRRRYDVWGDLLEPFLDTEFSADVQEATRERLRSKGRLSDAEIDAIRTTVETRMLRLTSQTWEWQHYGLYEVLSAMKPKLPFGRRRWDAFYASAMAVCSQSAAE